MADDKEKQVEAAQEQNKQAGELLSTLEKIKGTDKEILDLSKQLVTQSSNIVSSMQKRLDKSTTAKELSKSLAKLEQDKLKTAENAKKLTDAQTKSIQRHQDLTKQIAKVSQEKNKSESRANQITDSLIKKEEEILGQMKFKDIGLQIVKKMQNLFHLVDTKTNHLAQQ